MAIMTHRHKINLAKGAANRRPISMGEKMCVEKCCLLLRILKLLEEEEEAVAMKPYASMDVESYELLVL
ncbi:hypothetical protein OUZ56_013828 [Daphnia magna]|uniref:Uncharacterized protein n=1 Tax=Daphnia magna TaxID=35525 RepID=A0ABQ9Z863_9CRUS|nr:hypothetical protein OUZ56_013828 [Daphnia magna]